MASYIVKRILQLLPVILVIICVNFFIVRLAPGDPIYYLIGDASVTPEFIEELRKQYGFDQPLYKQLLIYLAQVAQGDLGYSFVSRDLVSAIILSRMPASLLLLGSQFVLSIIFGIALGVISAYRRGSTTDHAVSFISLIGFAVPAFWLGQMLILVFALWLDLFPSQGMRSLALRPDRLGRRARCAAPSRPADSDADHLQPCPDRAGHARQHDQRAAPRIHHLCALRRGSGKHGGPGACVEERDPAGHHRHRPQSSHPDRGRGADRDGVRVARASAG